MNIPPFPDDYIPTSPEARRRLIAWGMDCARMGAEAERLSFYPAQVSGEPATARKPLTSIRPSATHEWRLACWDWRLSDQWTWELHYLLVDDGVKIRCADKFEAELLNECKRLVDAARVDEGRGG